MKFLTATAFALASALTSALAAHVPSSLTARQTSCTSPAPNTCTFYSPCLESAFHCGANGYPLAYGLKYCTAFSGVRPKMSSKGQAWVTATMLCLQKALVPDYQNPALLSNSCDKLRTKAFGTHPECYVKSGLCTLLPSDWKKIVETVSFKELFASPEALKATLEAAGGCAELYAWLLKEGVWKVVDGAVEWVKGWWEKLKDFVPI